MEDHQKKLEIMEKYYQKIGTNFSFKLPDEITRKQLDNAKAKFARGLEEETILGFYDTTVLGSGKNGFIFTDSKIYFLETLEKPKKIWYDDIQNIEIYNQHKKDHDRVLEIILENGDTIEITSSFVNKTPLFEFLNELLILEKGNEQVTGQVYDINQEVPYNWADLAGYGVGNRDIVNKVYDEEKFHARQGHGFAAERANNLYDRLHGHDAQIIGDDNSLNGADRIVNGIEIQSKYCKTGSRCVNECFNDNGKGDFRYYTQDGTPMQIEVPSDMYDAAVTAMEEKIKRGQVKGVTDPKQAKDIIRKGNISYEQAKNIAKAGNIDSLKYDMQTGAVVATTTFGITATITFATNIWNGEDIDVALKEAAVSGIKVGGGAFVTTVLSGQLVKSGFNSALVGTTDTLVAFMGSKASAILVNAFRDGNKAIYGAAAMKSASKILRGNIITAGVSMIVLSSVDVANIFNGKISGKQLFKNLTNTAGSIVGGTAGWAAGTTAGATIGSAIPGIGTAIGATVGGIIGSVGGGVTASKVTDTVVGSFIEDDAEEMIRIIQKEFQKLSSEYLLNKVEAEKIVDKLQDKLDGKRLKEMFASSDHQEFARNLLRPLMEKAILKREYINLPTDAQMIETIRDVLEEVSDRVEFV